MEALSGVKQVLLRAKYHTDQIESMLHEVTLEKAAGGESSAVTGLAATSIEICACPTGYAGNSCEKCDYGYRKSSMDSWLNECVKCDCHGHARSCDLDGTCHVSPPPLQLKAKHTRDANLSFSRPVSTIRTEVGVRTVWKDFSGNPPRRLRMLANGVSARCPSRPIISVLLVALVEPITSARIAQSDTKAHSVKGNPNPFRLPFYF